MRATVFNIQKFSIHDGPGIRTTVFLKGCSLRCFWCHNPESLNLYPELQIFAQKCIGCGKCIEVCPNGAHFIKDGQKGFDRTQCKHCGQCAEVCYSEALVMAGKAMEIDDIVAEVLKDKAFYENSGGGVTFSGGEPLLQPDVLKELLTKCKANGLHMAVETAGNVPWESIEKILSDTDLFLYDFKLYNSEAHLKATGVGNNRILENLKKLAETKANIWIRIPIVPGVNDNTEEMAQIAEFIKDFDSVSLIELLPFHSMGLGKYESLGMEYRAAGIVPPTADKMNELKLPFRAMNLPIKMEE